MLSEQKKKKKMLSGKFQLLLKDLFTWFLGRTLTTIFITISSNSRLLTPKDISLLSKQSVGQQTDGMLFFISGLCSHSTDEIKSPNDSNSVVSCVCICVCMGGECWPKIIHNLS